MAPARRVPRLTISELAIILRDAVSSVYGGQTQRGGRIPRSPSGLGQASESLRSVLPGTVAGWSDRPTRFETGEILAPCTPSSRPHGDSRAERLRGTGRNINTLSNCRFPLTASRLHAVLTSVVTRRTRLEGTRNPHEARTSTVPLHAAADVALTSLRGPA